MSEANSEMTLHSSVLRCDSFSCNCNSINSHLSNWLLRAILTFLNPLLRVYINQHSSNAYSVQDLNFVQQCIQISTRINSSNVHTYILRLFYIASCIRIFILINPIFNMVSESVQSAIVSRVFRAVLPGRIFILSGSKALQAPRVQFPRVSKHSTRQNFILCSLR